MGDLKREDIKNMFHHFLSVRELKKKLDLCDPDTKVMVQRVEDVYFDKNNYDTLKVNSEIEGFPDEFHPAWSATNSDGILLIYCHY
jgi:hypothetical protein